MDRRTTYTHIRPWGILALVGFFLLTGCGLQRPADSGYTSEAAHKVVRTAYAQMGKKYRSGGASPQKGFDCSGLIWWVYKQNGYKVPRITVDQASAGYSVPKDQARPGDIVVFVLDQALVAYILAYTRVVTVLFTAPVKGRKYAWKA